MPKWITLNGRDENGGKKTFLIHGAYNLAVGDRVTVFPSTLSTRIRAAISKGIPISVGARVVVVPHARYPQSRIARSAFSNYEVGPAAAILPAGTQLIYVGEEADFQDGSFSNLPIVAWLWDFGDPLSGDLNASTEQNPHHTYNHPGTFDVALQVTNDLLSDTANRDGAVRVDVPYPTSCSAVNLGGGRVRISWTPGDPNDACRLVRRGDLFPPYPTNGTTAYEGASTSIEEVLPIGSTYYYRVWGKYEGVFSEGYRDDSITVSRESLSWNDHDLKVVYEGQTWYGDSGISTSGGCLKITGSPQYGDVEYGFEWLPYDVNPLQPGDMSVCLANVAGGIEIWICAAPYPRYGANGSASIYLFNQLVWSGRLNAAIDNLGYIFYHNSCWVPE